MNGTILRSGIVVLLTIGGLPAAFATTYQMTLTGNVSGCEYFSGTPGSFTGNTAFEWLESQLQNVGGCSGGMNIVAQPAIVTVTWNTDLLPPLSGGSYNGVATDWIDASITLNGVTQGINGTYCQIMVPNGPSDFHEAILINNPYTGCAGGSGLTSITVNRYNPSATSVSFELHHLTPDPGVNPAHTYWAIGTMNNASASVSIVPLPGALGLLLGGLGVLFMLDNVPTRCRC